MKCGDWGICDLQFCKYYAENEDCVYDGKTSRDPTESEVSDDDSEICRGDQHDQQEYQSRVF